MKNKDDRLKIIRIAGLSALGYFLMLTYSISRPATESLFLQAHTSKGLPTVWLLVALFMLITVFFYNKFVVRMDLVRLMGSVSCVSALILTILILLTKIDFPGVYYALYVWKDIYIVVLVEIFYTFANAVFPIHTARWSYGFFGVMGSLGSMTGNLAVGVIVKHVGTANALWFVPPMLLIVWFSMMPFSRKAGVGKPLDGIFTSSQLRKTIEVVRKSSYLFLILLLIPLTQIAITMIDFEYNTVLQNTFGDLDIRTGIIGKVYAVISFGTLALHLMTGPILRLFRIPVTLLAIPLLLGSGVAIFALIPKFFTMAIVKVASKCFDYSLFRAAKEMLYIPLSYAEKTIGKSVVDMLTYRVAKGGASLLLMGLLAINGGSLVTWTTLLIILGWVIISVLITIRFRKKVSRDKEIRSEEKVSFHGEDEILIESDLETQKA
ncbi:MAG: Npt1/Npt2 family nucleotide transporter [Pseudomonadota bacterium]